ncbi:MAG TPA: M48 family metalloprotease [Fimbriimonadaceae bacterium]|nr:M48 family metalloprotease [Fimbriimonadaceae bacterium]
MRFAIRLWPLLLYGFLLDVVTMITVIRVHGSFIGPPMTGFCLLVFVVNPFVLPTAEMYNPKYSPRDEELSREFADMAGPFDVEPLPVHRLTGKWGRSKITAIIKEKRIFVTQAAIDKVGPEGVRWMLGHELAHLIRLKAGRQKLQERRRLVQVVGITSIATISIGMVAMRVGPFGPRTWIGIALMACALIPLFFLQPKDASPSRELELWCDKKGAEITGDPFVALEVLRVMLEKSSKFEAKSTGYPTPAERISQMEELCRASGITRDKVNRYYAEP